MFPNGIHSRARLTLAAAALALAFAAPAWAALKAGSKAPDFTTRATLAGTPFDFTLAEALKKGPVVLYFYPAAFTKGCTVEAHLFAEATDDFAALGATVIGVSKDNIETLNRFSVSECRNKFAVAADPDLAIARAFDAKVPLLSYADRTSFVILPDSTISYVHSALSPNEHVKNTLAAVKAWKTPPAP
ncbi:MAG: peroxiredoxin [Xanthomonadaceae bacterium]|nr:peroxiredoxin [Xanthomonadaceae bacterium]